MEVMDKNSKEEVFDLISFIREMTSLTFFDDYGRSMKMFTIGCQDINKDNIVLSFELSTSNKLKDAMIDKVRNLCDKFHITSDERFFTIQAGDYIYFVVEKRV